MPKSSGARQRTRIDARVACRKAGRKTGRQVHLYLVIDRLSKGSDPGSDAFEGGPHILSDTIAVERLAARDDFHLVPIQATDLFGTTWKSSLPARHRGAAKTLPFLYRFFTEFGATNGKGRYPGQPCQS